MMAPGERELDLKPVQVIRTCEVCNAGQLLPMGAAYPTSPPTYPHICNRPGCGARADLPRIYPFVRFYFTDGWNHGVAAEL